MKTFISFLCLLVALPLAAFAAEPAAGPALPFPAVPSASKAGPSLKASTHHWRKPARHVAKTAPNVVVIMLDDVGFGQAGTYGGPIHTPTLDRIANTGVSYNAFHTTALCSPTRAALLTGRNHHRVGNGVITEMAADWDGYIGTIPQTTATAARVLTEYGYNTAAFGKWHNTPATETTSMGPFTHWPTGSGVGFGYFYGFLAGETSQWEPRLVENLNQVEPPHDKSYHLSTDLADKAVSWMRQHRAYTPDKPFFIYYAPGAGHGPHHVAKEWADKYKGKFDGGWDKMREEVFARQKSVGWIPADAKLTPRPKSIPAWSDIPANQHAFQTRLMELYAGFVEQADTEAGRIIDELDRQGLRENTIVFYLFGDNGAATAGQNGSISELIFQNKIKSTIEQQMQTLEDLGGLDVLGSAKTDNIYHAGWGWAGNTPFQYMKQVASHLGGTRNPLAVSWPAKIKADKTPRPQFTHVIDVVPTIYEVTGVKPPTSVDGFKQDAFNGTSFAYTFNDPLAKAKKQTQYFEMFGNRAIYHSGWMASALGPTFVPEHAKQGENWDPAGDTWELYDLRKDFSQADNIAAANPQKVTELTALFMKEAKANKVFPIGGSFWYALHPEDRVSTPYKSWEFDASTRRMPEFTAPGLGRLSNTVIIDAEVPENASGVLYALGGFSGGLALFMDEGYLAFEYNLMMIERYNTRSEKKVSAGKHTIQADTTIAKPGSPGTVVIQVDGAEYARLELKQTVALAFTASETFDVGTDLGSPVSKLYYDRRPFAFTGKIKKVAVALK
jgi:arylsulfatase A-like enzyme